MTAKGGEPGRVLVVDDSPTIRESLRLDLEEKGFLVEMAASGEACLAQAQSQTHLPECIILDIEMPGMDGISTCRRLKADPGLAHIPVLFLTGHRDDESMVVAALNAGGNDFVTKPYSPGILFARVWCQVTICRAQLRLQQLAMTDELTGAYSRRFLFEIVGKHVKQMSRGGPPTVSCLMLDIDHFKAVNDELGHLQGDRVLRAVAETIRANIRTSDVLARFGGEEFSVILPHTGLDGARVVAEKIRAAVQADTMGLTPVTISVGVSCVTIASANGELQRFDPSGLIRRLFASADAALYSAKRAGRNCVVVDEEQPAP
ncbi:MAG: diguanylate cyclase [Deltaproteobacteria bacterium]|nr:diguanylate cyclase [Deltaproteobacteria bacterium]